MSAGILQRRLRHGAGRHAAIGVYGRITWDFVRYILGHRRSMRPRVHRVLATHASHTDVVVLGSRRATRRYLTMLIAATTGAVPMAETTGSA